MRHALSIAKPTNRRVSNADKLDDYAAFALFDSMSRYGIAQPVGREEVMKHTGMGKVHFTADAPRRRLYASRPKTDASVQDCAPHAVAVSYNFGHRITRLSISNVNS